MGLEEGMAQISNWLPVLGLMVITCVIIGVLFSFFYWVHKTGKNSFYINRMLALFLVMSGFSLTLIGVFIGNAIISAVGGSIYGYAAQVAWEMILEKEQDRRARSDKVR